MFIYRRTNRDPQPDIEYAVDHRRPETDQPRGQDVCRLSAPRLNQNGLALGTIISKPMGTSVATDLLHRMVRAHSTREVATILENRARRVRMCS